MLTRRGLLGSAWFALVGARTTPAAGSPAVAATPVAAAPQLTDARGQLSIGPPQNADDYRLLGAGATSFIYRGPSRAGVYVDDTTPDRDAVARRMVSMAPGELVAVGLAPDEVGKTIPGCICLQEWFAGWGPAPKRSQAAILWWDWFPPAERQVPLTVRAAALTALNRRRPRLQQLWIYSWASRVLVSLTPVPLDCGRGYQSADRQGGRSSGLGSVTHASAARRTVPYFAIGGDFAAAPGRCPAWP
jgi:hypothetical protein